MLPYNYDGLPDGMFIGSVGANRLTVSSLGSVNDRVYDEVIDSYLQLLANSPQGLARNVYHIPVTTMDLIFNKGKKTLGTSKLHEVKAFVGVLHEKDHWTTIFCNMETHVLVYLNSFGEEKRKLKTLLKNWKKFLGHIGRSVKGWSASTIPHDKQVDHISCGIFAMMFARELLTDRPAVTGIELDDERKRIIDTLSQGVVLDERHCHLCRKRCVSSAFLCGCGRRYHQKCLADNQQCLLCERRSQEMSSQRLSPNPSSTPVKTDPCSSAGDKCSDMSSPTTNPGMSTVTANPDLSSRPANPDMSSAASNPDTASLGLKLDTSAMATNTDPSSLSPSPDSTSRALDPEMSVHPPIQDLAAHPENPEMSSRHDSSSPALDTEVSVHPPSPDPSSLVPNPALVPHPELSSELPIQDLAAHPENPEMSSRHDSSSPDPEVSVHPPSLDPSSLVPNPALAPRPEQSSQPPIQAAHPENPEMSSRPDSSSLALDPEVFVHPPSPDPSSLVPNPALAPRPEQSSQPPIQDLAAHPENPEMSSRPDSSSLALDPEVFVHPPSPDPSSLVPNPALAPHPGQSSQPPIQDLTAHPENPEMSSRPRKRKRSSHPGDQAPFEVYGRLSLTNNRKARKYQVTVPELNRRRLVERFSISTYIQYLRLRRSSESLDQVREVVGEVPNNSRTRFTSFTPLLEGEVNQLVQDFTRMLMASGMGQIIMRGVDESNSLRANLQRMLSNVEEEEIRGAYSNDFNLLTHGFGFQILISILRYLMNIPHRV